MTATRNKDKHMAVIYDTVKAQKDAGKTNRSIADQLNMTVKHVGWLVQVLRKKDPEFAKRHPPNTSIGQSIPKPLPAKGYTKAYARKLIRTYADKAQPQSVRDECAYALKIAGVFPDARRDPAAEGVRS